MAVQTSTVSVPMPAMGDSVAEGTVLEWHKQEGDTVAADETLVEISTDKVDAEVPSPVAGTIARILAAEGDTVTVGAVLCEITPDDGGGRSLRRAGRRLRPGVRRAGRRQCGAAAPEAKTIDIVTPTGGESVTEGTILEWSVKVGDTVKDGDTVVEISTDKVDMELPAPASGTITEILAADGETVTVGQVIGRMSADAGASSGASSEAVDGGGATAPATAATGAAATVPAANGDVDASPVARRVAAAEGVDLSRVTGSARGGRITKADVLAAGHGAASANGSASGNGASASAAKPAGAIPDQGRWRGAGPLHGPEPVDPDRHQLSHARRDHAWTAAASSSSRPGRRSPSPISSPTRSLAWPRRRCR